MKGIPKGLCSFGRVTPHKMGRCRNATEGTYRLGQIQRLWSLFPVLKEQRNNTKAHRKG